MRNYKMRIYIRTVRGSSYYTHWSTFGILNVFPEWRFKFTTAFEDYMNKSIDTANQKHMEESKAMSHLEQIINGYEPENGVLLYLSHDNAIIKKMAQMILTYGKNHFLLTYVPDDLAQEGYYTLGPRYPNPESFDK